MMKKTEYFCDRCAEELPKRYLCLVMDWSVETRGIQKRAELCQACGDFVYAEATAVIRRAARDARLMTQPNKDKSGD